MAGSIADALKQIPADQIKSVEVITSPSAKYDAEGSAGIINIITKKNNLEGLSLNIDAGAGLRGSNLGLNGNYRKGKMGFSLGGFGRAGYNIVGGFDNTQVRDDYNPDGSYSGSTTNVQTADTRRKDLFGRYQLGWDYEINKKNSLAASIKYATRNGWNFQDDLLTRLYTNDNLTNQNLKQVETKDLSGTTDVNLDYTRTFNKPQRELTILALYSRNNRTNNFETLTDSLNSAPIAGTKNVNPSYNQEVTFQADYQTPISDKQMLELGGKNISRTVSSDYEYFRLANGSYVPISNGTLSNTFNYNQNVTGTYLSYTYNTKGNYSFKAGGRYEYTTISANFAQASAGEDVSEIPSYGVFVPSLNISRKLKAGNTIKAAYNRRIQRPSIQFLNPNIQASNPLLVTKGNPNLNPEYTDNYELSYSAFIKGTTLNLSGFVRNTTGAIQSVRESVGDVIYTTYQNIGKENAYGLNFFGNVAIGKKFSINGGADAYYAVLNNNKPDSLNVKNTGWVYNGRLFGNYTMKNGWGLQLFSFFRGRTVTLQGYQGGFRMYGLNLRKEFNNKKGSIGFGAENFLTSGLKIKNQINSKTFNYTPSNVYDGYTLMDQKSTNIIHNLSFRVNFSYRIGKMGFDAPKRKKSINNDDMKEGGGDNGGGGQMDQQGQQRTGGGQPQMGGRPGNGQNNPPAKTTDAPKQGKKKKN